MNAHRRVAAFLHRKVYDKVKVQVKPSELLLLPSLHLDVWNGCAVTPRLLSLVASMPRPQSIRQMESHVALAATLARRCTLGRDTPLICLPWKVDPAATKRAAQLCKHAYHQSAANALAKCCLQRVLSSNPSSDSKELR